MQNSCGNLCTYIEINIANKTLNMFVCVRVCTLSPLMWSTFDQHTHLPDWLPLWWSV